jgi:hypothetical protein
MYYSMHCTLSIIGCLALLVQFSYCGALLHVVNVQRLLLSLLLCADVCAAEYIN